MVVGMRTAREVPQFGHVVTGPWAPPDGPGPSSRLTAAAWCYVCRTMSHVGVRDLRNHTADVLRRVQEGEVLTITSRGVSVATLRPLSSESRRPLPRHELVRRLMRIQADPGLREDLRELAGETTDDLGPIR